MGCTGSTNALPPDAKRPLLKNMVNGISSNGELPSPVAFVVPLNEEEDSLIKKHPPKRLQRLEEQQTTPPPLTHKMLQDKLAEAEQRRLQILNERIESAKVLMKPKCGNGNGKLVNGMNGTPPLIDVEA
ncbi:uncharacterized protein LOC135846322 [Planococcus citri]|uniref:uncharacterized protein LOC135846322 n=1 Tax=Planococcus citri TaxID=170843 RepID=UPI0031F77BAB